MDEVEAEKQTERWLHYSFLGTVFSPVNSNQNSEQLSDDITK